MIITLVELWSEDGLFFLSWCPEMLCRKVGPIHSWLYSCTIQFGDVKPPNMRNAGPHSHQPVLSCHMLLGAICHCGGRIFELSLRSSVSAATSRFIKTNSFSGRVRILAFVQFKYCREWKKYPGGDPTVIAHLQNEKSLKHL